jgi:mono/diheme cytochrome c family protein
MSSRLRLITLVAVVPMLGACDWFTDFKQQPRVEAWEPLSQMDNDTIHAPRGQPQNSVPITGTFVAGYQVGYGGLPGVVDSIGRVAVNPTPVSPASLVNGRKYYTINCSVCHGDTGIGNGPATQNGYGMPGISIISDQTKARSDGYIYGMLRNGRGLMPTYNRIEEMDRWDVVNYVARSRASSRTRPGWARSAIRGRTAPPCRATPPPRRPVPRRTGVTRAARWAAPRARQRRRPPARRRPPPSRRGSRALRCRPG